jgi:enamine deaminase RidA (YjgF/YER057c/UK114 family)
MSARREIVSSPQLAGHVMAGAAASEAVRGGDFLFVSGLIATDQQSGMRMPGTTASETRQILNNLTGASRLLFRQDREGQRAVAQHA